MSNNLEYKEKYEKYKLKYINLKNIIQEGSAKGDDDDSPKGEIIGEGDSDDDFDDDFGEENPSDFGDDFGDDFGEEDSSNGETIGQIPANIQQPVSVITWTSFLDANGKISYKPSDNSPSLYLEQMPDTWKDASGTILNKAVLIAQQQIQELQQKLKDQEKQGQQLNLQLQNQEQQLLETQQESPPTSPPGSPSSNSNKAASFFSGIASAASGAFSSLQAAYNRRQERIQAERAATEETKKQQQKLKETEAATKQLLAEAKQAEAKEILAAAERAKKEAVKSNKALPIATNSQKQVRWAMKMKEIKGKLRVYFKPDNGNKPVWYKNMPNTWIDPKRNPVEKRNGLKDFLINNKESVLNLVKKNVDLFEFLPTKLREDYDIALAAVKINGLLLEFVPKFHNVNDEKNIVLAAVQQNGFALQFAGKLQDNSSIVEAAYKTENKNRHVLKYATDRVYKKYYSGG
jgi:hypothetical protein